MSTSLRKGPFLLHPVTILVSSSTYAALISLISRRSNPLFTATTIKDHPTPKIIYANAKLLHYGIKSVGSFYIKLSFL